MQNDDYRHTISGPPPREAPHSIEAEQGVLGALLLNNELLDKVGEILSPEHFYDPLHGQIYDVIQKTILSGRQASPPTIKQQFESHPNVSSDLTVPQYLGRLTALAWTANAVDYSKTVRELWTERQLVILGEDLINAAYDSSVDLPASTQIEMAEARLYSLAEDQPTTKQEVTFDRALKEAVDRANEAYMSKGAAVGLSTGLCDLDEKLGGLHSSDLIILAGRPSMGKTALVTNIAAHVASKGRVTSDGEIVPAPVLFYSLEMSAEQLATRILSEQSGLPSERIRRGKINMDDFRKLTGVSQSMSRLPIYVDQTGGISIAQLAQRARRLKRRHGAALIIIDYLQLMSGAKRRDGNRVAEVTEITTGLKALAKELEVPIIALSQLSRKVEERSDKRPQLSDLRESGSIEQDADVVMFVYREEYYVERQKPSTSDLAAISDWETKMRDASGKAEIIIGKQRHGPLGIVDVAFDASLTKFSNLARSDFEGRS